MKNFKESLTRKKRDAEFRLEKHHKDTLEFNLRAFRRRKLLQYHMLEQKLMQEVGVVWDSELQVAWILSEHLHILKVVARFIGFMWFAGQLYI